jgi:tight adherence protein B
VLIVPLGMALAGMSMGNGRAAYATPVGQLAVAAGIGMVVLCWVWAGSIMRIPEEERVFSR